MTTEESRIKIKKQVVLFFLGIFITGILVYIPRINELGIYRDDWNNYYNAIERGAGYLKVHYASDRPADGYLLAVLFKIFKTNNTAYLIYNLLCRIIGSCALSGSILLLFPNDKKISFAAGVISVIFPGFSQQIEGISYAPHQTAMMFYMVSIFLTLAAEKSSNTKKFVLLTIMSVSLAFISICLMEYYVGMEAVRYVFLFLSNQNKKCYKQKHVDTLKKYIPYFVAAMAFVVWRVWFFDAARAGTSVTEEIIEPFKEKPLSEASDFIVRYLKNIWKLFVGSWTVPVSNMINSLDKKSFIASALPASAAAIVSFYFYSQATKQNEEKSNSLVLIVSGIVSGSLSIVPLVLSKHDITFALSLDRFSFVGMVGSIFFLLGIITAIRNNNIQDFFIIVIFFISAFIQVQNKTNYIDQWKSTRKYWQQLIWRAPSIKEGTTIISGGALLAEEDYDIFVPANMIYYTGTKGYVKIGAEVLNTNTIQDIVLEKQRARETRKIYVEKDYSKLIAISKPTENSCLGLLMAKTLYIQNMTGQKYHKSVLTQNFRK